MLYRIFIFIALAAGVAHAEAPASRPIAFKPFTERLEKHLAQIEMIPIAAGEFEMSSEDPAKPRQRVRVGRFFISKTEVPWELFDVWAFSLDSNEYTKDAWDRVLRCRPTPPNRPPDHGFGHNGYPAIGMTYDAGVVFCNWLSAKTGRVYRLPTEAEWEYAARAGSPVEVDAKDLDAICWYDANSDDKTQPIGKKKPNAWGLHDMLGNVQEWCTDADGKPITRGGSWKNKAVSKRWGSLNYAFRQRQDKSWNERDPKDPKDRGWLSEGNFIGLRIVCEVEMPATRPVEGCKGREMIGR